MKAFLALVIFILAVALILFIFPKYLHQEEPSSNLVTTSVSTLHQFSNGVHTYVGIIETPTPCYTVSGNAIVKESYPEQVDIRIETHDPEKICAQVVTAKKFKVSFRASAEAVVTAYLNGVRVLFKVKEASPTVNLETVEI